MTFNSCQQLDLTCVLVAGGDDSNSIVFLVDVTQAVCTTQALFTKSSC